MNTIEKRYLKNEVEMQLKALRKISIWKTIAIAVSTLGVAITYAGVSGTPHSLFLGILGAAVIIIGAGAALVLNLGLKNGRRNVEKMLHALK